MFNDGYFFQYKGAAEDTDFKRKNIIVIQKEYAIILIQRMSLVPVDVLVTWDYGVTMCNKFLVVFSKYVDCPQLS